MAVLGDLEQHVMASLWRAKVPLSVRDVHELLHYDRDVAYTTVLTVLDRLAKKGVVARAIKGRAWIYSPLKTCVDLHVDEMLNLLNGCGQGHAEAVIAGVQERLAEVYVAGQDSCLTTGDPAWVPGTPKCAFAEACSAVNLDCSQCPAQSGLATASA